MDREVVCHLREGVFSPLIGNLLLYHSRCAFGRGPKRHLDGNLYHIRRRHTHTALAIVFLVLVVIRKRDSRSISPSRHVHIAFGKFGRALYGLIIKVITDIERITQQSQYSLGREDSVNIVGERQFGLYGHVQQHFEAVGGKLDIPFLGVNRVLEGIDTHADLVGSCLLGSAGIHRVLCNLLKVLDIRQRRVQKVGNTLKREHGDIAAHHGATELVFRLLKRNLLHLDGNIVEKHSNNPLSVQTDSSRHTECADIRHVDFDIRSHHRQRSTISAVVRIGIRTIRLW